MLCVNDRVNHFGIHQDSMFTTFWQLTCDRSIESVDSELSGWEGDKLHSMLGNKHAFIRTSGIDQNPILYGALNRNSSVVEVLPSARRL